MQKNKNGFTIVELLIVIVVIGILAAITVVAYNGVQNRAHNAQRKQDLAALAKGLELYRVDNNQYPNPGLWGSMCVSDPGWDCWDVPSGNRLLPAQYMSKMPQDPKYNGGNQTARPSPYTTRAYGYQTDSSGSGYILATYMPGLSPSDPHYWDGSTDLGTGGWLNWANYVIRKNL